MRPAQEPAGQLEPPCDLEGVAHTELADLQRQGPNILAAYIRNVKLALPGKAQQIFLEVRR